MTQFIIFCAIFEMWIEKRPDHEPLNLFLWELPHKRNDSKHSSNSKRESVYKYEN